MSRNKQEGPSSEGPSEYAIVENDAEENSLLCCIMTSPHPCSLCQHKVYGMTTRLSVITGRVEQANQIN